MTAVARTPVGILLTNLGTPDAPTTKAVRRYLAEFLSDRRVIPLHPLLWQPILRGIILRTRPQRSAELYRKVWMDEGSPLLVHSRRQRDALQAELDRRGHVAQVALAMRYGQPSIAQALETLGEVHRLIVLPLYPQFSYTTTTSTLDALELALQHHRTAPTVDFISGYARNDAYIEACASQIRTFRAQHGASERLLLSFHGLPKSSIAQGDPYAGQCRDSAWRIARALGLPWAQWVLSFQSRFGPKEWLTPYTNETLCALAAQGVQSVDVFCPGFASDCLETLEEIEQENRDVFLAAGGKTFRYIPALNDSPEHIRTLANLIEQQLT